MSTAVNLNKPVVCPDWCALDHGDDIPEDVFHRSARAWLKPDASRCGSGWRTWELVAHIVVPEVPEDDDPALLVIDTQDGVCGPHVELAVDQVDEFVRQAKVFLARVEQMRDQLVTTVREQQS